jgi:peptidyl-prolyl cis-trans isomerase SurA
MGTSGRTGAVWMAMAFAALPLWAQKGTDAPQPSPPAVPGSLELDHVVAVAGSSVILQSDVVEEMQFSALEPLQVLPGENTPAGALRRLIDRTLILEQMREQQQAVTVGTAEAEKGIAQLRREIPACAQYDCQTEQGWDNFLRAHGLDPQMALERWNQRMAILRFIDLRFRSGIRVTPDQISTYYDKTLVPALEKNHEAAPPLANVSGRIQEILLQQQVSGLFQDWLASLRDQGNVRIVDQAYSADLDASSKSPGGEGNP